MNVGKGLMPAALRRRIESFQDLHDLSATLLVKVVNTQPRAAGHVALDARDSLNARIPHQGHNARELRQQGGGVRPKVVAGEGHHEQSIHRSTLAVLEKRLDGLQSIVRLGAQHVEAAGIGFLLQPAEQSNDRLKSVETLLANCQSRSGSEETTPEI